MFANDGGAALYTKPTLDKTDAVSISEPHLHRTLRGNDGRAVQGIGQALTENAVYSKDRQLLTAGFIDYAIWRADNFPWLHFETRNVPSTTNVLGMKCAGEAGAIGSTPATLNALSNALYRACGVRHINMPATPSRVWATIRDAVAE